MTATEMLRHALRYGRAEDGDLVVYADGYARGCDEFAYAVFRRSGDRSEGMHGMTERQAIGFIASLRCSTDPTDQIVASYLRTLRTPPMDERVSS